VIVERELGRAVVEIEERAALRIGPPQNIPRQIRAFEMLGP
jgi:hypothetical protein